MVRKILVLGSSSEIGSLVVRKLRAQRDTVISIDAHGGDISVDFSNAAGRLEAIEKVIEVCTVPIDAIISTFKSSANKPLAISTNYFGITQFIEGLYQEITSSRAPRISILNFSTDDDKTSDELINIMINSGEKNALKFAHGLLESTPSFGNTNFASSQMALQIWVQSAANESHWKNPGVLINSVTDIKESSANEIAEALIWLASPKNKSLTGKVLSVETVVDQVLATN